MKIFSRIINKIAGILHRLWRAITTNDPITVLYTVPQTEVKIKVTIHDKTVWLTQKMMSKLFETSKQNISSHIKNIFEEGELDENSTVKDYLTVRNEGGHEVKRNLKLYNLGMIVSVGYHTNSRQANLFKIWAKKRTDNLFYKLYVKMVY